MTVCRVGWYAVALAASLAWAVPAAAGEIRYHTRIEGIGNAEVRETLEAISRLVTLENDPPRTMGILRRRARADIEAFDLVARSEGYYDARIDYRIDSTVEPVQVTLEADPGPAYEIAAYDAVFEADGEALVLAAEAWAAVATELPLGRRAEATTIVEVQTRLMTELTRRSFAFAKVADRRVEVDHRARSVSVRLTVQPGPSLRFGETDFSGLVDVKEEFVRRRIPWKEGEAFSSDRIAELRTRLTETGLFQSVHVRPAHTLDAHGRLPVEVEVRESKFKSVGAGVFYSSSDGAGGDVFWEHRNLRGKSERLRIGGTFSEQAQSAHLLIRRPDFLVTDQVLGYDLTVEREEVAAYHASRLFTSLGIERAIGRDWVARGGLSFETGPVKGTDLAERDTNETEVFNLLGLRLGFRHGTTNDLLDPTQGTRTSFTTTPYTDLSSSLSFMVNRLSGSVYVPVLRSQRLVLAGRGAVGSILGADRSSIPSDKRFYAGGGGSVRGYRYQLAGPLASDGNRDDNDFRNRPLGGRSLIEVGVEARLRFGESFGVVPFIDGGNVYPEVFPSFDDELFWGAGLGLRYFTGIGPLRVDLATPLRRRSGVDDRIQFYVSLGQAF